MGDNQPAPAALSAVVAFAPEATASAESPRNKRKFLAPVIGIPSEVVDGPASPSGLTPTARTLLLRGQSTDSDDSTEAKSDSTDGFTTPYKKPRGLRIINPGTFALPPSPERPMPPKTPVTIKARSRTNLHLSVLDGDIQRVAEALEGDADLNPQDEHGFTPLMSACALVTPGVGLQLCKMLLDKGADRSLRDNDGFLCLHWAAEVGNTAIVRHLVTTHGMGVDQGGAVCGETCLHRASRLGRAETLQLLLAELGADPLARSSKRLTCLDVAGSYLGRVTARVRTATRRCLLQHAPRLRTLVVSHPECVLHDTGEGHLESPLRVDAIMRKLVARKVVASHAVSLTEECTPAPVSLLQLAHSQEYITFVHQLAATVSAQGGKSVPFTPRVQRTICRTPPDKVKDAASCDTSFSVGTLTAALRAVGAACRAVDMVVSGTVRNAFVVARPPGHHAGPEGLLEDCVSCGFCVFNNVAIAALHALSAYPAVVKRVAIVDVDVHHGNGTEEIVRKFNDPSRLFFSSIHLFDKNPSQKFEFYPGSGKEDGLEHNIVNMPLAPLWRQQEERSTRRSPRGCPGHFGRQEFRRQISERLLPALRAFNPDLILISAGFDGGRLDAGNSKMNAQRSYVGGLDLEPADYAWFTERVGSVARLCCDGRVVSVLEGGYGRWERKKSVVGLNRENLATNCCTHIRALSDL